MVVDEEGLLNRKMIKIIRLFCWFSRIVVINNLSFYGFRIVGEKLLRLLLGVEVIFGFFIINF